MAWNGIGSFVLNPAYSPEVNGNVIDAVRYNGLFTDLAIGLTAALAKNGENVPTANLRMGGYKHTGAANASAAGQYLVWGQPIGINVELNSAGFTFGDTRSNTAVVRATGTAAIVLDGAASIGTGGNILNKGGATTFTVSSGTLTLTGVGPVLSTTLATYGWVNVLKVSATEWWISGIGLS